jgi:hypothetical protein
MKVYVIIRKTALLVKGRAVFLVRVLFPLCKLRGLCDELSEDEGEDAAV